MSNSPPWGDAQPLAGCEVIGRPAGTPPPRAAVKKPVSAIVKKVLAANHFLDKHARTLTSAAVVVWALLWRDERDGGSRTAVSDLARRAGVSQATAQRALRLLRESGFITVRHRGYPTRGPTVYRVFASPRRRGKRVANGRHG